MSWPEHAGIMSLSTANSSFILLRRLRSINECAVFRAIFLPAAVLEPLACFRFWPAAWGLLACDLLLGWEADVEVLELAWLVFGAIVAETAEARGFISMILRERVGGGGRV